MKFRINDVVFSVGIPFLATAAFFLAGDMRMNYCYAVLFSALHETGHIIALLCFGKKPKNITFGIMGIRIETTSMTLSYRDECIAAICGPFVNLIFAVIFAFVDIEGLPFAINSGLFVINMLPVKTLDGGRFLHNLMLIFADEEKTDRIMRILEIATVIVIIAVMLISLMTGYANTSFVFFSVTLVMIILLQF